MVRGVETRRWACRLTNISEVDRLHSSASTHDGRKIWSDIYMTGVGAGNCLSQGTTSRQSISPMQIALRRDS